MRERATRAWRGVSLAIVMVASGGATAPAVADDAFGANWPAGEGRELTGAWCGGCHSLDLVRQQGMTRAAWDRLLDWMSTEQNMPPLGGERRERVLDYLATHFNVDSRNMAEPSSMPTATGSQGVSRPALEIRPPQ